MSFDPSQVQSHAGRIYLKKYRSILYNKTGGQKAKSTCLCAEATTFP